MATGETCDGYSHSAPNKKDSEPHLNALELVSWGCRFRWSVMAWGVVGLLGVEQDRNYTWSTYRPGLLGSSKNRYYTWSTYRLRLQTPPTDSDRSQLDTWGHWLMHPRGRGT